MPVCERITLLPHYLRYYERHGVTKFVVGLWNGRDNPLYPEIVRYAAEYPLEIRPSMLCSYAEYNGPKEVDGLNQIREEFVPDDDWYAIADLDEFCYYSGYRLADLPRLCRERGVLAVHGQFVDRVSATGELLPVPVDGSLDETYPFQGFFTRAGGACCEKILLAHKTVPIWSGHHQAVVPDPARHIWYDFVEVHHFKWVAGLRELLATRSSCYRAQRLWWWGESRRFIDFMEDGRLDLDNPAYEVRPARRLGV